MKIQTLSKLALVSILTISTSVFAEDKINWTGFYGSAMVGRDWGHVGEGNGFSVYPFVSGPGADYYTTFGNNGSSFNGWSGNFKLGYNKQIDNNLHYEKYFEIINLFLKKINKGKINIIKIQENIYHTDFSKRIDEDTPEKFITWLIT